MKQSENNIRILEELRKDSRKSFAIISRETGIPVSTIFDNVEKLEKNIIKRYATIIDFSRAGYNFKVCFMLKSDENKKEEVKQFLACHPNTNTLLKVNNGYDFSAEMIFKDLAEIEEFTQQAYSSGAKEVAGHYIIEDLKREGFLLNEEK